MPLLPWPDFSFWRIALHLIDLFVIDSAKPLAMVVGLYSCKAIYMRRVVVKVREENLKYGANQPAGARSNCNISLVPVDTAPESKLRVAL